ncbi:MAG: hypothetical protein H6766_00435 [Candidatus Peribacteria bacterium]|nr:MAG: hypothetical protein H6766_00435 [Candidatus Peribacteria bacterium]
MIKGDQKIPAISIASIVAKVERDHYMIRQSKKFPEYSFEKHKGYGTQQHRDAIREHGMCALHRESFCGKISQ